MHAHKTYIVTGAASGIGAETARILKKAGATVIGVDRNEAAQVDAFYQADLGDPASIEKLIEALPREVNGLANIAGVPPTAPAETVIRVNLTGLIHLTERLIPKLADGASIVNLASLAGFDWQSEVAQVKRALSLRLEDDIETFCAQEGLNASEARSYFLSKQALIVWTLENRWAWRNRNINMNAVSPGPVETPILKDFLETLGERAEEDMKVMDRPGTPQDIAPIVAFALSDDAKWLRGANLTVDGGMSSHILTEKFGL
jgi:NAD(P)-dependent dehydrogenase (short-subunit alcohol dehydrogenase family)